MAKEKFQLTSELVKVEPEPELNKPSVTNIPIKENAVQAKEKITINIDPDLKLQVQMYAIKNRSTMTDIIHEALKKWLEVK